MNPYVTYLQGFSEKKPIRVVSLFHCIPFIFFIPSISQLENVHHKPSSPPNNKQADTVVTEHESTHHILYLSFQLIL
jgi:hypothetical protein